MKRNFSCAPIMKDEIRAAIRKMKLGKITGPHSISVERFEAFEEYGIDKTAILLYKIYDTGQIPSDNSRPIFIALPKKDSGPTECDLPRAISHITKYKRRATFFGHVMRREKLKHLVTIGMIGGKRVRGK